ncbi:MAG: 3'-5' exonuclease [Clostridiales bacterium]|nr:3'-5' exonuclease [Clostridiales bacterium]
MNKIYQEINTRTNGKYDGLRFSEIVLGDCATVTVSCRKEDRAFVNTNAREIESLLSNICAFHIPIKIKISDASPTQNELRAAVVKFTDKFSYVSSIIHTIAVDTENGYRVRMKMHDAMYEFAKNDYLPRLDEFLKNKYVDSIELAVDTVKFSESGTVYAATSGEKKEYSIKNAQPIIGALTPESARSIASITENAYNLTACGVYAMPTSFSSKGGRRYDRFVLYDGDAVLQCRFSPESGVSLADPSLLGKTVCVFGNAEYDAMRNEASLAVRELSVCDIDDIRAVQSVPVPKQYAIISPKPYEEYVQSSMFDGGFDTPPALNGSFVVFDFETTGLSVLHDKPTEIGAVKVVDGKLTESFCTLINPRRPIPQEVAIKTGITDEMVKGQPLFEDILPDFYKFSYGCSFVCHNISFDFPFLLKAGNRCGYAFGDRRTFDTMSIAPIAIPGIQKLSLDRVLEGLGLINDNAHRALSDAVATAKAFVAMHRILAKK